MNSPNLYLAPKDAGISLFTMDYAETPNSSSHHSYTSPTGLGGVGNSSLNASMTNLVAAEGNLG